MPPISSPTPASEPASLATNAELREALISLLLRGASPAAACTQLGLMLDQFREWSADPEFQARLTQSQAVLSQNVAAALYRSAMEGSVSAQTFYLKHLPPPEWPAVEATAPDLPEHLTHLTNAELLELFRTRYAVDPTARLGNPGPAVAGHESL